MVIPPDWGSRVSGHTPGLGVLAADSWVCSVLLSVHGSRFTALEFLSRSSPPLVGERTPIRVVANKCTVERAGYRRADECTTVPHSRSLASCGGRRRLAGADPWCYVARPMAQIVGSRCTLDGDINQIESIGHGRPRAQHMLDPSESKNLPFLFNCFRIDCSEAV